MFGLSWRKRWNPSGSLAIVTGASSGIGRELVALLIADGCRVIAVARRAERLAALTDQFGDRVVLLVGDVTDPRSVDEAIAIIERSGEGRLDLLVNNAGIGGIGRFDAADESRLRQIMEVNFFAPAMWCRRVIPLMRSNRDRHPVICNIGSVLGHCAVPLKSEYCASKFALHGLSDSLRTELAGDGIAVTLVSPSTTRSEFFDSLVGTDANQVSRSIGSWPPERVAQATLRAIKRRDNETILSLGGKSLVYTDRIVPALLNQILSRSVKS
ncbi:SDR family NAD(P)-dependent oxidoreductase [Neorhodopirellula pilleata]|uniref:3-oxoacyl-[acyl-carrier-protein] reductase FabG n=1 Tax=Neorhodopirellula pilleata TaxID=2714738 RepID=A0A5C6AIH3_9BACT|nr:SDR family NAD(P)-dependent oxidoreductase [Neorhodopirellula pilleata]TWT98861.1 3-oxoacyl-[acyl-carrier-protein] reductase FabG [Neorhodopirellula pilleata]